MTDEKQIQLPHRVISEQDIFPVRKLQPPIQQAIYLLPVNKYPLPHAESMRVREFCESLIAYEQKAAPELRLEVILTQDYLYPDLLETFVDNAQQWAPKQGLAVIPHEPPPHLPTRAEIENVDITTIDPDNPRGLQIGPKLTFLISDQASKGECYKSMLGHGAVSVFLSRLGEEELYRSWKEIFGKRVTDRLFRGMPLFVPLLGMGSFQGAHQDEIDSWFETFDLYIGESADDKGIIVAAAENLDPVIANLVKGFPNPEIEPVEEILRW